MIIGSSPILTATFRDPDGDLVDPDVTLTIQDPTGTTDTPTPDNPSTGVYEYELELDVAGIWWYRWEGSSSEGTVVCERKICVEASSLVMS